MWKARLVVLLAVLLLPGVMLAPVWRLAGLGAGEDDILYYFPTRTLFHDTLRAGHWPWFNPWTGLGRPFSADPQTAVWYPPTYLFALLPPLQAYPICLWAHYSLALWGMYRLLRAASLDRRAALFGGVAFAFCGFMLAHRAHFAMQNAAAWAPLVFWRLQRLTLDGSSNRGRKERAAQAPAGFSLRHLASAAGALALQVLAGHAQIAALTAMAALVFLLACGSPQRPRQGGGWALGAVRAAARWLMACIGAVGLTAIQWLPTLDYVRLCTRVERTYADFVENSWYPVSAVGWLTPMLLGQRTPNFFSQPYWGPSHQVEQFSYAGVIPLLLAAVALRPGWRADARHRPWIIVGLFGLLLALGQFGPLCPLLYWVPGSSLFRCPARALLLVNLAVAALAAGTLDDLGTKLSPQRARLRAVLIQVTGRPILLTVLLIGGPLLVVLGAAPWLGPASWSPALWAVRPWNPAVWVPFATAFVSIAALGLVVRRWKRPVLLTLPILLSAIDLAVIGWTIDVPPNRRQPEELITPRAPAEWMDSVRESAHRLWVVTGRVGRVPGEYVDPLDKAAANTNILQHIATLTDYGPLQPRSFAARFGFTPWGETTQAEALLEDTRWTRAYNVGWILLCEDHWPAPADGALFATTPAGGRLYHSAAAEGYAFLEDASQPGAVQFIQEAPMAFTVLADTWPSSATTRHRAGTAAPLEHRPRVVVSLLALPGWTARVNGKPTPVETAAGGLLAIPVPAGEAVEITCSYFPPGLWAGAGISAAFVMGLGACGLARMPRRRARRRARASLH